MSNDVMLQPADQVTDRLNDPTVAASVISLLDNAELLSTLVTGLSEFLERGDTIVASLAQTLAEAKGAVPPNATKDVGQLVANARVALAQASDLLPILRQVTDSGMVNPDVVALLAMVSESAVEGAATARANQTVVKGVRGAMKSLKDPEVQHGLGLVIEISRSLGRRMATS